MIFFFFLSEILIETSITQNTPLNARMPRFDKRGLDKVIVIVNAGPIRPYVCTPQLSSKSRPTVGPQSTVLGNKLRESGQGFDLSRFSRGPHQSMIENKASCPMSILLHRHSRFGLHPFSLATIVTT